MPIIGIPVIEFPAGPVRRGPVHAPQDVVIDGVRHYTQRVTFKRVGDWTVTHPRADAWSLYDATTHTYLGEVRLVGAARGVRSVGYGGSRAQRRRRYRVLRSLLVALTRQLADTIETEYAPRTAAP